MQPFKTISGATTPSKDRFLTSFLLAAVWPFPAAVRDLLTFDRNRTLAGFVVFCIYAGWVFAPTPDSDGYDYAARVQKVSEGFSADIAEPIPSALVTLVGNLGMPIPTYFMALGLIYGLIFRAVAGLLFSSPGSSLRLNFASWFFGLAFLLHFPVFAALNARYQLGLWGMMAATLLALQGRWLMAAATSCVLGFMIHFGFAIFAFALVMVYGSQRLGRSQVVVAYGFLALSFLVPESFFISFSNYTAELTGGSFAEKVALTAEYAQLAADKSGYPAREASWFLLSFTKPVFWALMLSGQLLWLRIRFDTKSSHYQLWILVLFMWGLHNVLGGEPETAARVQRNATALLFLFHARWFLEERQGARAALAVTFVPVCFYLLVYYRIWLGEAAMVTVFPSPFGFFKESFPRVYEFFSGR